MQIARDPENLNVEDRPVTIEHTRADATLKDKIAKYQSTDVAVVVSRGEKCKCIMAAEMRSDEGDDDVGAQVTKLRRTEEIRSERVRSGTF